VRRALYVVVLALLLSCFPLTGRLAAVVLDAISPQTALDPYLEELQAVSAEYLPRLEAAPGAGRPAVYAAWREAAARVRRRHGRRAPGPLLPSR
jgi:hypothetical protein